MRIKNEKQNNIFLFDWREKLKIKKIKKMRIKIGIKNNVLIEGWNWKE
jgi:hypothetical protein